MQGVGFNSKWVTVIPVSWTTSDIFEFYNLFLICSVAPSPHCSTLSKTLNLSTEHVLVKTLKLIRVTSVAGPRLQHASSGISINPLFSFSSTHSKTRPKAGITRLDSKTTYNQLTYPTFSMDAIAVSTSDDFTFREDQNKPPRSPED